MKTINLLTKGESTICFIQNKNKGNYIIYKEVMNEIYELCHNYNEINIDEKTITISNSKLKVKIENHKNNTNSVLNPVIKKLKKEYREIKINKLRKQKIKRIGALSCVILISSGAIANLLCDDKVVKGSNLSEDIKVSTTKVVEENSKINFVEKTEEQKKNDFAYEEITAEKDFEINFESRVNSTKFQITNSYYNKMITKISNEYGIDPRIILAIATQECGVHNPNLRGPAIGLMQIERAVWVGHSISAYNYNRGTTETLNITEEKLKELEFNIRTSCMILKDCLKNSNYNLPVAIQMYNFGYGNMKKVFKAAYGNNINFKEKCLDYDNSWLEYRDNISAGDKSYLEHILSYVEDLDDIQIKNGNEIIKYSFNNKIKTLS